MGICNSNHLIPQILVLGLDGAGKTTFLYADKWDNFEPTHGFNYEEIKLEKIVKVGLWDVSGKKTLRCLWPLFYKNMNFNAVVFIVDSDNPDRYAEARKELHILVNEEELRQVPFLIIFNTKQEQNDLKELSSRLGLDLIHPLVKIKTALVDLSREDDMFREAINWLRRQISE
jgi:GTPase SAR1 family protein